MSEEEKKIKARENAKKYYQKHREKILARQKEYVRKRYHTDEEFRKRTLENHKRYENNNLERVKKIKRDAQKKYYQQHIDYYRNYSKQWSKEKYNSLKKEIERLNNIINELEKCLEEEKERLARETSNIYEDSFGNANLVNEDIFEEVDKIKYKLQELKGDSSNE